MMTAKPFGRRVRFEPKPFEPKPFEPKSFEPNEPKLFEPKPTRFGEEHRAASASAAVTRDRPPVGRALAPPGEDVLSDDEELQNWKRARRRDYKVPWRQVLLMASLCFGVAGFVLPDTVSGALDWLFYALMAASFIAALRRRQST